MRPRVGEDKGEWKSQVHEIEWMLPILFPVCPKVQATYKMISGVKRHWVSRTSSLEMRCSQFPIKLSDYIN